MADVITGPGWYVNRQGLPVWIHCRSATVGWLGVDAWMRKNGDMEYGFLGRPDCWFESGQCAGEVENESFNITDPHPDLQIRGPFLRPPPASHHAHIIENQRMFPGFWRWYYMKHPSARGMYNEVWMLSFEKWIVEQAKQAKHWVEVGRHKEAMEEALFDEAV